MPEQWTGGGETACPSDLRIARYVDKVAEPDEMRLIRAHLAGCDRCSSAVMDSIEIGEALDAPEESGYPLDLAAVLEAGGTGSSQPRPAVNLPFPETRVPEPVHLSVARDKRPIFRAPGPESGVPKPRLFRQPAVLATAGLLAAGLVLAVGLDRESRREPAAVAGAPSSVGHRTVDARLSDGDVYLPYRGPTRSANRPDGLEFEAAEAVAREAAESHPTDETLHAWGLALLRLGRFDKAVEVLEDAAERRPKDPGYQSDAGAARLTRFINTNRQEDAVAGLGHVDAAIALDNGSRTAWFNRGILLEALERQDEASAAWRKYLELDPSSEWAAEARSRVNQRR